MPAPLENGCVEVGAMGNEDTPVVEIAFGWLLADATCAERAAEIRGLLHGGAEDEEVGGVRCCGIASRKDWIRDDMCV